MNDLFQLKKQEQVSVFRKWIRKGYAIFLSLGRVVHIGCLAVDLVNRTGKLAVSFNLVNQETETNELEAENGYNECSEQMLLEWLSQTELPVCAK